MKGNFEKRSETYMKQDVVAQKKYGVHRTKKMLFPNHRQIPLAARIAIRILGFYEVQIVDALRDKEGKK